VHLTTSCATMMANSHYKHNYYYTTTNRQKTIDSNKPVLRRQVIITSMLLTASLWPGSIACRQFVFERDKHGPMAVNSSWNTAGDILNCRRKRSPSSRNSWIGRWYSPYCRRRVITSWTQKRLSLSPFFAKLRTVLLTLNLLRCPTFCNSNSCLLQT